MRVPALLILAATVAPASAQVSGPPASGRVRPQEVDSRSPQPGTGRDIVDVRERIRDGQRDGSLDRRAARGLRRKTGMIGTLADRYAQDGTSDAEQRELDTRTAVMRDQVAAARARGRK